MSDELPAELRALLARVRASDDPTPADARRVRHLVTPHLRPWWWAFGLSMPLVLVAVAVLAHRERSVAEVPRVPLMTAPPAPRAVRAACSLDEELAVLAAASAELEATPLAAAQRLETFAASCEGGGLVEERLATRALALCAARRPEGALLAREVEVRFPESPSRARLASTCLLMDSRDAGHSGSP